MKIDRLIKASFFSVSLTLFSFATTCQDKTVKEKRDRIEDRV
jgi:hypothetical protein